MGFLIVVVVLILTGIFWRQILVGLGFFLTIGVFGAVLLTLLLTAVWLIKAVNKAADGSTIVSAEQNISRSINDTSLMTPEQRAQVGEHIRACWEADPGTPGLDKTQVLLTVTTDAAGVARKAVVTPQGQGSLAFDARLQGVAERASRAVLDPRCANLPLPASVLGRAAVLTFRFSP